MAIRWDDDEKDKLAAFVAQERMHDLDASLTTLLNKAQDHVLDHGRRRGKLPSHKLVSGFDKLVKVHITRLLAKTTETVTVPVETDPQEIVNNLTIGDLVDSLVEKIALKFSNIMTENMSLKEVVYRPSRESYHIETGKEKQKKVGPVIGVIGMYKANFTALENRLKNDNVRLKYLNTERSTPHFPLVMDFVVCVPNRLPHTWVGIAKEKFGAKAYFVNGRLREAEKVIKDIVVNGKSDIHYKDGR